MNLKIQRCPFKSINFFFTSALIVCLFILQVFGPLGSMAAVGPMEYFYGLVAGQGDTGNRDGAFQQVLFQEPTGLALNEDETTLYVADGGNQSIRAVELNHQNFVSTLIGNGKGLSDGSFKHASFNTPRNLAMLPNNLLAVYDSGNACIRLVDLKSKSVTTWFQIDKNYVKGTAPDPAVTIYDMVYSAPQKTLYYSQPQLRKVMKITLGQTVPTEAYPQRTDLTRPGALVLLVEKILVGDLDNGNIYPLESLQNTQTAAAPLAKADSLNALTSVGPALFALPQRGEKILHPLDNTFTYLPTSEGAPTTISAIPYFLRFQDGQHPQWIASKFSEKKFYITSKDPAGVFYFKDYNYTELKDRSKENSHALSDFEYPAQKPRGTFRILMVGDSHSFFVSDYGANRPAPEYSRILTLPKRLERILNSKAALDNSPIKYEVLFLGHASDNAFPLTNWPYYYAPSKAEIYDADLVLFMAIPQVHTPGIAWFLQPITAEGIPAKDPDSEYYQKPWTEKAPEGTVRRHYLDLCVKKKLCTIDGVNLRFAEGPPILHDPDLSDDVITLMGQPLGLLSKKICTFRTKSGKPVHFAMCYAPLTIQSLTDYNRMWRGIAQKFKIPLIDLTSDITALRESILPGRETGHEHLFEEGHDFLAQLLAHALVQEHWLPTGSKP